jgi:hypothetical protein
MERAQIDVGEGNAVAALSVFVGTLALAAAPAGVLLSRYSALVTLRIGIAGGSAVAAALAILTLLLARHGRWRAARSVVSRGGHAARNGRLLGTLALCAGLAGGIALATDAVLTHFQQ